MCIVILELFRSAFCATSAPVLRPRRPPGRDGAMGKSFSCRHMVRTGLEPLLSRSKWKTSRLACATRGTKVDSSSAHSYYRQPAVRQYVYLTAHVCLSRKEPQVLDESPTPRKPSSEPMDGPPHRSPSSAVHAPHLRLRHPDQPFPHLRLNDYAWPNRRVSYYMSSH